MTNDHTLSTRKLSLHERFSLARRNMGFPHSVTILVVYSSPSALPDVNALSARIQELQEHFPLLSTSIADARTREPKFKERDLKWSSEDVLQQRTYKPETAGTDSKATVLFSEVERAQESDLDVLPLWQVSLYTAQSSPAEHEAYLTLSADHALIDGKGDFNLLKALLAPEISDLPYEKTSEIPTLEESMDIIPGYLNILGLVWSEIIVPSLPSFIRSYFQTPPFWPANLSAKRAIDCPPALSLVELPSSIVAPLKAAGRAHGVPSLHPILKFSLAVAIWEVLGDTLTPFVLKLNTPGSVRDMALKHSYCAGNYTSSVDITLIATPATNFWLETSKAAQYMRSPKGRRHALHSMGSLVYVPDPKPDPAKHDTDRPTGWEEWLMTKAQGEQPVMGSVSFSNIGQVDLPRGATDLIWAQGASPIAPPFSMNAIGHSGGLRVTTVWRDGAALTTDVVRQVEAAWVKVLNRLADVEWKGETFGELIA